LFMRNARPSRRRLERVEVAHDQINRLDALLLSGGRMFGIVADEEKAAVNLGMERLDPAIEDLGEAGYVRYVADGQAGIGQGFARAAGRDQFDVQSRQGASQVEHASFVADAQ